MNSSNGGCRSGSSWRSDPWRPSYLAAATERIEAFSSDQRQAFDQALRAVLKTPLQPKNFHVVPHGKFSDRWPSYRLTIPGSFILVYAPIEYAPPVYLRVVVIERIYSLV